MDVRLRVSPFEIIFNNKIYDPDSVTRSVITKLAKSKAIPCEIDSLTNIYFKTTYSYYLISRLKKFLVLSIEIIK